MADFIVKFTVNGKHLASAIKVQTLLEEEGAGVVDFSIEQDWGPDRGFDDPGHAVRPRPRAPEVDVKSVRQEALEETTHRTAEYQALKSIVSSYLVLHSNSKANVMVSAIVRKYGLTKEQVHKTLAHMEDAGEVAWRPRLRKWSLRRSYVKQARSEAVVVSAAEKEIRKSDGKRGKRGRPAVTRIRAATW